MISYTYIEFYILNVEYKTDVMHCNLSKTVSLKKNTDSLEIKSKALVRLNQSEQVRFILNQYE